MEDDNSMSERILRTLETILNNDPELKEFVIIPADTNTKNKSPVLYEDHCIGLESWCIKHIYRHAYLELFELRRLLAQKKLSFSKERSINRFLIGVLLINPDMTTFWNMKRELVEYDVIGVTQELLFTKMVLSHKSKSNETFGYRKWLLSRVLSKIHENDQETPLNILQNELGVCEMAAARNSNNYHAWTHRIWCMENVGRKVVNFNDLILRELDFSQRWVSDHVSEHTGYHYRQYLFNLVRVERNVMSVYDFYYNHVLQIFKLDDDGSNILTFLLGKGKFRRPLEEVNNFVNFMCLLLFDLYNTVELLNAVFPNHEAMWYHRRFLVFHLIKTAYEYHNLFFQNDVKLDDIALHGTNIVNVDNSGFSEGEKQPKIFKSQVNDVEASVLYRNLVKKESEFIRKNLAQSVGLYEHDLVKRYERWLNFVVGIQQM